MQRLEEQSEATAESAGLTPVGLGRGLPRTGGEGPGRGKMLHMERDDPRGAEPTTNNPAESADEGSGERGEERVDVAESSGYTTTKQAAKALGVSRRTVQSYVRRGELEAFVEGEGVEKTFFVSIDSLDALRERRRVTREGSPRIADNSSSGSAGSGFTAKAAQSIGEDAPELIEIVQDLQYRLGRAEAQVELTARTESTLREQLAREQERADRLEAELREARPSGTKPPPEPRAGPETASEGAGRGNVRPVPPEPAQRRSSWWRRFFGFE